MLDQLGSQTGGQTRDEREAGLELAAIKAQHVIVVLVVVVFAVVVAAVFCTLIEPTAPRRSDNKRKAKAEEAKKEAKGNKGKKAIRV